MSNKVFTQNEGTIPQKLLQINWFLVMLICLVAGIGFVMLYSAGNASFSPWAEKQMVRFAGGFIIMLAVAVVDIRLWLRHAYVLYALALILLLGVEFFGLASQGAQRWLVIGGMRLQPSEIMKIGVVLALARYFHQLKQDDTGKLQALIVPVFLVMVPVYLVMAQPDLGTAGLILLTATAIFFVAGVATRYFVMVGVAGLALIPLAWQFLHEYQKKRVLTFLDPERDALGAGYHVIQSKIALGSGGLFGRGFLNGTQSHLNFLPEKQTDFIFTMLGEEFGLFGAFLLILLYMLILVYGYGISLRARNQFGRLIAAGVITTFFLYFFINMAMVMGVFPVVGIPLPLISYGGTAMLSILISFGLLMNVWVHRDVYLSRQIE